MERTSGRLGVVVVRAAPRRPPRSTSAWRAAQRLDPHIVRNSRSRTPGRSYHEAWLAFTSPKRPSTAHHRLVNASTNIFPLAVYTCMKLHGLKPNVRRGGVALGVHKCWPPAVLFRTKALALPRQSRRTAFPPLLQIARRCGFQNMCHTRAHIGPAGPRRNTCPCAHFPSAGVSGSVAPCVLFR